VKSTLTRSETVPETGLQEVGASLRVRGVPLYNGVNDLVLLVCFADRVEAERKES